MMTIAELKQKKLIIFECISGSKAYGLDLPTSDTDIKGVFVLPEEQYYGLDYISQINDETNDTVYYELKRFIELLFKNNPNLLEMLYMSNDCILHKNPLFDLIKTDLFLSKLCQSTFAGYAATQIKRAKGLNKKIRNPVAEKRKTVLDFCYITVGQGSQNVQKWLEKKGWQQAYCGLVNINNMQNLYGLYYDHQASETGAEKSNLFKGIVQKDHSNDISLSSIPKKHPLETFLSFNKDGYKKYCKDYREYWNWVAKRNEVRYQNTIGHGKNYDAKNMMHTFRLLDMAEEIARLGKVIVKRPNRDFLLKIRAGAFSYKELLHQVEEKLQNVKLAYQNSKLMERPNKEEVNQLLFSIRKQFYLVTVKK